MFDNIGKKIKTLAKTICYIGIAACIIAAIAIFAIASDMMYGAETLMGIGFAVLIVGPLVFWIGSFSLYGFGELIDNSQEIKEKLCGTEKQKQKNVVNQETANDYKESLEFSPKKKNENCLKVSVPEIVSEEMQEGMKQCPSCGRVLPSDQAVCKCGEVFK